MKILPDGATNGTRNSDKMLEPRPAAMNGFRDQIPHHGATLHPELAAVAPARMVCSVPDHQSAKTLVAHQDVGAESQHEVGNIQLARSSDRERQFVCGGGLAKEIRGPADLERGERGKDDITARLQRLKRARQRGERGGVVYHRRERKLVCLEDATA